jgi:hypothetical protein
MRRTPKCHQAANTGFVFRLSAPGYLNTAPICYSRLGAMCSCSSPAAAGPLGASIIGSFSVNLCIIAEFQIHRPRPQRNVDPRWNQTPASARGTQDTGRHIGTNPGRQDLRRIAVSSPFHAVRQRFPAAASLERIRLCASHTQPFALLAST